MPITAVMRRLALTACLVALVASVPALAVAFGTGERPATPVPAGPTLSRLAAAAGCALHAYGDQRTTSPPTTGRFSERDRVADGAHATAPRVAATIHALLHGRVVVQYRPGVARGEVAMLERLAGSPKVVVHPDATGMQPRVAATAYLQALHCRTVTPAALRALRAFSARRSGFGQEE